MIVSIPMTADEKLWELKLQVVSDQIGNLGRKLDDKLGGLSEALKSNNAAFVKILDDHEGRLRKQSEIDSAQGAEISNIRVQISNLEGQMRALSLLIENANKREEDRLSKETGFWQKAAFELLKVVMAAGTGGGAVYIGKALRLF